jgi:acyl-CoA thioesterase
MNGDLLADLALRADPDRPGRYLGELGPAWSYVLPSGGVLMSFALRAMREHLAAPDLPLVSASSIFCDPIPEGPVSIDVTVLRRGKSAAQLRGHLRPGHGDGGPHGLEVSATFLADRAGPDAHPARMPDVPAPEQSIPFDETRWPFLANFDIAQAIGDPMWRPGWKQGDAHQAFWHRYRKQPLLANGELDPIALPPIADTMPGALVRFLGPGNGRMYAPSLDLTVYFTGPVRSEWLLVESRASRARAGSAIGHCWIWTQDGQLVAQANQAMFLRRP